MALHGGYIGNGHNLQPVVAGVGNVPARGLGHHHLHVVLADAVHGPGGRVNDEEAEKATNEKIAEVPAIYICVERPGLGGIAWHGKREGIDFPAEKCRAGLEHDGCWRGAGEYFRPPAIDNGNGGPGWGATHRHGPAAVADNGSTTAKSGQCRAEK